MVRMKALIVLLALAASACSGSNPNAPTPPPVQPQPITMTVRVTGTGSGQPLAGLAGDLGGVTAQTDGNGAALFQTQPGGSQRLSLTGAGIVPRSVMLAVGATRDVRVDAIETSAVDLNFYRQFVRNGFDAPNSLQPLRRLQAAPRVYLRTVDEAGAAIDARTLDTTERAIVETAAMFTGGQFGVASVEQGTDTRAGQAGWLTVRWPVETGTICGRSTVGQDGGAIDLLYKGTNCGCPGLSAVRPRAVRHELGHALGFYHTDAQTDVMFRTSLTCDALPSARERAAAAIAYARPVGNQDPDADPASVVTLAPMRVP